MYILISNAFSSEEEFISSSVIGLYVTKQEAMKVAKSYVAEEIKELDKNSGVNVFDGDNEVSYYYNLGSDESVQYIVHEVKTTNHEKSLDFLYNEVLTDEQRKTFDEYCESNHK